MRRRKDSVSKSRLFGTDCPILHELLPHTAIVLWVFSYSVNFEIIFIIKSNVSLVPKSIFWSICGTA